MSTQGQMRFRYMIHTKKPQRNHHHQKSPPATCTKPSASTTARRYRCGKNGHAMKDCHLSNAICNFCGKKGHIEAACITKQRSSNVNLITTSTINSLTGEVKEPSPHQLGPRYEGQLMSDGGAYSPSAQSSSYSLTTLSSHVSTDRWACSDGQERKDADAALRNIFCAV